MEDEEKAEEAEESVLCVQDGTDLFVYSNKNSAAANNNSKS